MAGKRRTDRMVWMFAVVATLVVICATLVAGYVRKESTPTIPVATQGISKISSDNSD